MEHCNLIVFFVNMASASWQEELRQRLVERNTRESAYAGIIDNYSRSKHVY